MNFKGNEIKLVFDENIKLKNLKTIGYFTTHEVNEPIISPTSAIQTLSIK
jgi:hypothetical protein